MSDSFLVFFMFLPDDPHILIFHLQLSLLLSALCVALQVHTYQRLTPFSVLDHAVESIDNLRQGDCIVCFSKNDIYSISRQIEAKGVECAVIYGSLPPGKCVFSVCVSFGRMYMCCGCMYVCV